MMLGHFFEFVYLLRRGFVRSGFGSRAALRMWWVKTLLLSLERGIGVAAGRERGDGCRVWTDGKDESSGLGRR